MAIPSRGRKITFIYIIYIQNKTVRCRQKPYSFHSKSLAIYTIIQNSLVYKRTIESKFSFDSWNKLSLSAPLAKVFYQYCVEDTWFYHLSKLQKISLPFILLLIRITSLKFVEHLHFKGTGKECKFLE